MKTLRRLTASVVGSVDWMIGQFENHEALVTAAIKEVEETSARARVQLKRVTIDGQQMRKRLIELTDTREVWKERAAKTAATDEKRALECVRRKQQIDRVITQLEIAEREHTKLEKQLAADLQLIEERLRQLRNDRNLLRSRESRAQALTAFKQEDSFLITELDDIFDRWETKICEYELRGNCRNDRKEDELETSFETEEELTRLREGLQAILAEKNN